MPNVFRYMEESGDIKEEELYRSFNMGVGMVVVVPESEKDEVLRFINEETDDKAWAIGVIEPGEGVVQLR